MVEVRDARLAGWLWGPDMMQLVASFVIGNRILIYSYWNIMRDGFCKMDSRCQASFHLGGYSEYEVVFIF